MRKVNVLCSSRLDDPCLQPATALPLHFRKHTPQSPGAFQPLRIPDSMQRCLLQWLLT